MINFLDVEQTSMVHEQVWNQILEIVIKKTRRENEWTHPMSHITVPTMDKTNASNAKGSPNKNPNGLQSPIVFLSCS
jgi:hypothetical protein